MMTYFPMKPSIRITRLTLDQKESRYKHNPVKHLRSILPEALPLGAKAKQNVFTFFYVSVAVTNK
jgi:hypothetical protein